jgi:hypothetical protein
MSRVLIAVPNLGKISTSLGIHIIMWMQRHNCHAGVFMGYAPVSYARNHCVTAFLEWATDPDDRLWFIDSDTTPPVHALEALLKEDVEVISGAVPTMKIDQNGIFQRIVTLLQFEPDTRSYRNIIKPEGGVHRIDACGAACLLIKRSVFDKVLGPPWFKEKFWHEKGKGAAGEDLLFCEQLRELGIPIYGHFDVFCQHRKPFEISSLDESKQPGAGVTWPVAMASRRDD